MKWKTAVKALFWLSDQFFTANSALSQYACLEPGKLPTPSPGERPWLPFTSLWLVGWLPGWQILSASDKKN